MRIWLALLAAPGLALASQALMYALVTPACSIQTRVAIHLVALVSLVLSLLFTVMALGAAAPRIHAAEMGPDHDSADAPTTRHFLAVVAAAVGAISSLVIFSMWIAAWVLSPCWS